MWFIVKAIVKKLSALPHRKGTLYIRIVLNCILLWDSSNESLLSFARTHISLRALSLDAWSLIVGLVPYVFRSIRTHTLYCTCFKGN